MNRKLIAGLVALGVAQVQAQEQAVHGPIPPEAYEPEIGWTTVISTTNLVGRGGEKVYECDPGKLPWRRGECREQSTFAFGCGNWINTATTTYLHVLCDGKKHKFPTFTYWLRNELGRFYQVGTVTPTITIPQFCQGPYLFNYTLNMVLPDCLQDCQVGWHRCDPPDPLCPPYCYNILPICCPEGWDCYTAWDPIGQLYYGVCCRYVPPGGWQCF
jgi:hypothetical protein